MLKLIQFKKTKQTKKPPLCYLGGIWALHTGYGSCIGGLLLCHRSRCRWPCMRSPGADSYIVGAQPCWAGSWVKLMPCSPGRRQKHNDWFFCYVFPSLSSPDVLTCLTTQRKGGIVGGCSGANIYNCLSVITKKMLLELQHYGCKPNKETNSVANISFVIYRRIYGALTLTLFLEVFLRVFSHVNNPRQSRTSKYKTRHLTPYNRLYIRKSTKRADIRRNFYSESVSCSRGKVFKRLHQISQIRSTLKMKKN